MAKKEEKFSITYESEGEVHEEAQALARLVEESFDQDSPEYKYIVGFRKTADLESELYNKNLRLLEKVQDMNKTIITNAQKVKTIFEIASKDSDSLYKLKEEYENATKVISSSYQSEKDAKQRIAELRQQVSQLAEQVRKGEAFSFGTDASLFETSNEVNNLRKETEEASATRTQLQQQIDEKKSLLNGLQADIAKLLSEEARLSKTLGLSNTQYNEIEKDNNEATDIIISINPQIKELKKTIESNSRIKQTKTTNLAQLQQSFFDSLANLNSIKDELKQHKEKITRRAKVFSESTRKGQLFEEEKENKRKQIDNFALDYDNCLNALNQATNETIQTEKELEEQIDISKQIQEEKSRVRVQAKSLRQTILNTIFKLATEEAAKYSTQRQSSEARSSIQKDHQHKAEENAATTEEKNKSKTIRSETISQKGTLQEMKEKILNLFHEIDQKRTEHFQTQSRILVTLDFIQTTNEQFALHTKEFEQYKTKNEHQTALSEKTRKERNNYKRSLETIDSENRQISALCDQLSITIKETSERITQFSNNIFNAHVSSLETKGENKILQEEENHHRNMILQVERIISRLNAERQTLAFILHEAENDHKEQENEHQTAEKHFEIIRDENIERQRKITKLRSDITTNLNLIDRSHEMYSEKLEEIKVKKQELDVLDKRTKVLERKCELVKQLKYKEHKITMEMMLESHKSMTLVHEFAIPRNVHRWDVLEAVDPGYVKNLKYRMDLFLKLDAAHRELVALQEEREALKKELGSSQEQTSKALTKAQVEQYISKYTETIAQKNEELKKMQENVHDAHPSIRKSTVSLDTIREKVNQRKSSASALHTKVNIVHFEQNSSSNIHFLTESETFESYIPTLGGGFVNKITSPTRRKVKSDLAVFGQSRPQTHVKYSPLLSPQKRTPIHGSPLPPLNKM